MRFRTAFIFLTIFMWSIPVSAQTWTQLFPATRPGARWGHAMVSDATRQNIVLFGGYDGGELSDTWEWNGNNWLLRTPVTRPTARHHYGMAYDSVRQRAVLFGGAGSATRFSDTWEWDGNNWLQRMPISSPTARSGQVMAYDAARQKIVLFGGYVQGSGPINDTWCWDGNNWNQHAPSSSPGARWGHAMAYDSVRQKVVLFGGNTGGSETWEWDGNNWIQRTPTISPSGRNNHAMAYDFLRQKVILFGGYGGGDLSDTWEWDGNSWIQRVPATSPTARDNHAMAHDAVRQRIVLFGGNSGGNEMWEYSGEAMASYYVFGSACFGTAGFPTLMPLQLPRLGQFFSIVLFRLPANTGGMVFIGFDRNQWGSINLPFDLTPLGLTGCSLYTSVEFADFILTGQYGIAGWGMGIPNNPELAGLQFFNQAVFPDSGANPGGFVFTNAGAGVIGR